MVNKSIFDQVLQYVMTVTDEEFAGLSVGILAYSFKIDRHKLSRQFKRHTGMTLEDFLFKEKMARAAFLLKVRRGITVKEVSKRIGFCTTDYFIRRFREYYGIAPGRYKDFKTRVFGIVEQRGGSKDRRKMVLNSKATKRKVVERDL